MGADGWMGTLARRWAERVLPSTPQTAPLVAIRGEYVREVPLPPAQVWSALATPANHGDLGAGFVIPAQGPEQWCLMSDVAGALFGTIVDVVEREEGHRIALRLSIPAGSVLRDWAVFDAGEPDGSSSLVRLQLTLTARGARTDAAERSLRLAAEEQVGRFARRIAGVEPLGSRPRGCLEHRSASPLVRRTVEAQLVVPLPVPTVAAALLDPTAYRMNGEPGRSAMVVPGTPAGEVGGMWFEICPSQTQPFAWFLEVVELGPGHRRVLRHHTASHPSDAVTTVSAHPDGSLVRIEHEVVLHEDHVDGLEAIRRGHLASLVWLSEELLRRASPERGPQA